MVALIHYRVHSHKHPSLEWTSSCDIILKSASETSKYHPNNQIYQCLYFEIRNPKYKHIFYVIQLTSQFLSFHGMVIPHSVNEDILASSNFIELEKTKKWQILILPDLIPSASNP